MWVGSELFECWENGVRRLYELPLEDRVFQAKGNERERKRTKEKNRK